MYIKDLKRLLEAPSAGHMIAYLRKEVIFESYGSIEEMEVKVGDRELLELHLFDNDKEYRALSTESKRFDSGVIEHISDFLDEQDSVYRETCVIEKNLAFDNQGRITILNHISYDDNGMAVIDDYRFVMGGK